MKLLPFSTLTSFKILFNAGQYGNYKPSVLEQEVETHGITDTDKYPCEITYVNTQKLPRIRV